LGGSSIGYGECFQFSVKRSHIQELRTIGEDIIQFIAFVHAFYAFEFPKFYNHCNREGEVTIIPFAMGTHQGDIFGGALFPLVHFKTLHSTTSRFPSCLFPYIADDIHIIGPPSIISYAYEHFQIVFCGINIFIQPQKCATWSPLVCCLILTPHLYLTPHKKELGSWGFHWVFCPSHHFSSKMFYWRMLDMLIFSL
jgi:hypothetical protein